VKEGVVSSGGGQRRNFVKEDQDACVMGIKGEGKWGVGGTCKMTREGKNARNQIARKREGKPRISQKKDRKKDVMTLTVGEQLTYSVGGEVTLSPRKGTWRIKWGKGDGLYLDFERERKGQNEKTAKASGRIEKTKRVQCQQGGGCRTGDFALRYSGGGK